VYLRVSFPVDLAGEMLVEALRIGLLLVRMIHHSRGASLGIRHHSAFASLANTASIRSVTENAAITTTLAIRSFSGELSRLVTIIKTCLFDTLGAYQYTWS